jgi:starch-binding outer membrane protein, SusD/RagB family
MKKLRIYILALLMGSLLGCSDWLDIRPENEVVLEDYWQTESQAMSVLSACYRGLATDECVERMLVWGELRSDNLVAGNTLRLDLFNILNVNVTPTNNYANWGSFYAVINYCNTFLKYAPAVVKSDQNFTESKLHTLEAEALTIRALSYFYLVRAFNEVPLILTPSINDTQNYNVPKSTERAIVDQIIADLLKAKQYARLDYGVGAYNKGRISLNAVNAILADVYLWDQQYSKCIESCDLVVNTEKYNLVDGDKLISDVFYDGNSTESIFELQFDKDIQFNNTVNAFYGFDGDEFGELSFPVYLKKEGMYSPFNYTISATKESTKDLRATNFFGTKVNGDGYPVFKYAVVQCVENTDESVTPRYRSISNTVNWVMYRLADVLLMKAEALVQLERNEEALRLVNETYLRANEVSDSLLIGNYASQIDMEKLVLRERQRELMFEGKRWFDLMRLVRRKNDPTAMLAYISPKLTGDNMQIKKMSVMNALYMPILKSELEINTELVQNPFYEDTDFLK